MPRDIQVKLPQDTPSRGDPTVTEHLKKGRDAANDILSHPLSGDSDAAGLRQDRKGNSADFTTVVWEPLIYKVRNTKPGK